MLARTFSRFVVLTLVAVLGVLACASAGPAPARAAEVGLVSDLTWSIPRDQVDKSVALMKGAGAKWTRLNVNWSAVERDGKGVINRGVMDEYDYAVKAARGAGIEVLMPMADGVPYWASADPQRRRDASGTHYNVRYRPRSFSDYADFAKFIARHFAPLGVHAYEVWNEPNLKQFWPSGPNPAAFAEMLRAAYPAIKSADPSATVVSGGLSQNDYDFLRGVYNAGGRPYFDVAGVHPYTSNDPDKCWNEPGSDRKSPWSFCGLEEMHATMAAHGDGDKPLWATEFGWSTYTKGVSQAAQSTYLLKGYKKLESYPWVEKAFWYGFRNVYYLHDDPSNWDAQLGLVRSNYTPKPAFFAYKSYAATHGSAARYRPQPSVRVATWLTLRRATARATAASYRTRSRFLARGRVAASGGRVILVIRRWSPSRHRWIRGGEMVRRVGSRGNFQALIRVHFRGVYAVRAAYRQGRVRGDSHTLRFRGA